MYYQYDDLNTVSEITDRHGDVIEQYRYDAFGNIFTGITAPYNTKGYTGHEYDDKTGLVNMNARWYSPNIGRFMSQDTYAGTLDNPLSQNRYAYVLYNPVNMVDPSGNIPVWVDDYPAWDPNVQPHTEHRQQSSDYFSKVTVDETWTLKEYISHYYNKHRLSTRKEKKGEYITWGEKHYRKWVFDYEFLMTFYKDDEEPSSGSSNREVIYEKTTPYTWTEYRSAEDISLANKLKIDEEVGPPPEDATPLFSTSSTDGHLESTDFLINLDTYDNNLNDVQRTFLKNELDKVTGQENLNPRGLALDNTVDEIIAGTSNTGYRNIKEAQVLLDMMGFDIGAEGVDGYAGKGYQTWNAISKFKTMLGIGSDGTVDQSDIDIMKEVLLDSYKTIKLKDGSIVHSFDYYEMDNMDFRITSMPHYTNDEGQRGADAYNLVIDQFNVDNFDVNQRFKKRDVSNPPDDSLETFCNVFAHDVLTAMGVEIPFSRANNMAVWLKDHGAENGWKAVDAKKAQAAANRGEPAIVIWFNNNTTVDKGKVFDSENPWSHFEYPGHIAIIRPENEEKSLQDPSGLGVYIAQAGWVNYNFTKVEMGFYSQVNQMKNDSNKYLRFYIHN